jgi:CubicO group peptidase (beta-lactamase class C family)
MLKTAASLSLLFVPFLAGPCGAADVTDDPRVGVALDLARTWLEAQREYDRIPGLSAAIVYDQQTIWSGGYGFADLATRRPADAETIYSICSISKLFTSVAVMQQRDAGKVRLDDPVSKYLPWFSLKKTEGEGDVTIEGLLTHASGLPRESDYPYWSPPDYPFPTAAQIRERVTSQNALYAPESRFQYSNLGMTLAGDVAEAASGIPYAEYVKRNILDPLGLSSTTPEMPEAEKGKRLAAGYTAHNRKGERRPTPFFAAKGIGPAAGYASTANDLARFAQWQFRLLRKGGTEVLKATTLREMQRVHWAEPDLRPIWGLGFAIWREGGDKFFVGHGGSCPGYRSGLLLMPREKIATAVLANAQGVDTGAYAQTLYSLVAPALQAASKDPGKGKAPDPSLRPLVGAYDTGGWSGEAAVVLWEDGLGVIDLPTADPLKEMYKLRKTGDNTFRRILPDDSLGEEFVFEVGSDGKPTGFRQHSNFYPRIR